MVLPLVSFYLQITYRRVRNLQIGVDKLVYSKGADKLITSRKVRAV